VTPEQSGIHQFIQAPRQCRWSDSETFLEFIEARQAVECVAQNQDAPPLTHAL
jgi:hypothetical protein